MEVFRDRLADLNATGFDEPEAAFQVLVLNEFQNRANTPFVE